MFDGTRGDFFVYQCEDEAQPNVQAYPNGLAEVYCEF
jgi:hypothetical protein